MDELSNPYRPGAGAQPPALIGRDELINRFGVTLRRALIGKPGKSLMPIGLRGVGKTVLLNRFCEIAETERLQYAYIEAPETKNFRFLLAAHLRKVLLNLQRTWSHCCGFEGTSSPEGLQPSATGWQFLHGGR